jgi:hypothetical protein
VDTPPEHPTPEEAESYFRQMLADGEFEQPDDVEYDPAANELIFFWHEPKLAVVPELDSDSPLDVFPMAGVQPPV